MQSVRAQLGLDWELNPKLICKGCGNTGSVKTRKGKAKRGVSGGKATGAILTGGLSLLATGLSRKVDITECKCGSCGSTWEF